ncbi:MAG TPA: 2-oxo acid dehydrogenase subunit E2, partial [Actinomycetota bacterium]|nr:2-oxo acid dehydrogenase subunit E2 [Actinomycetota bacterium]
SEAAAPAAPAAAAQPEAPATPDRPPAAHLPPGTAMPPASPPSPTIAEAAPVAPAEGEEIVPMTRMRQVIAEHMVASVQTSARAWTLVEVNMENVVRLREKAKETFAEREGVPLTYMPFVASAVDDALLAFPHVNAELRGEQLILRKHVNLGIAVALEDGLIVPVVTGADSMNIAGLARAINDVATRARNRQLKPDEVHGSTFTITNPGPFGSIMSVPIINQPNSAILAFDTIEKRPVVVGDAIAIRHMVYLSMSWDHRVIDGSTAAQFLARVRENLETWDFAPEVGLPAGS